MEPGWRGTKEISRRDKLSADEWGLAIAVY